MKKYYLVATYPSGTLRLKSYKDFRKCKEIRANGKRLLIDSKERIVDLTGATIVLMGKDSRSYE